MINEIKGIPDSFFEEERFLIDENNFEDNAVGVLGVNASSEQRFKFFLCGMIRSVLLKKQLSNSEAGKLVGIDGSEISRLMNLRIDRFTIDKLIKISEKIIEKEKIDRGITEFMKAIA